MNGIISTFVITDLFLEKSLTSADTDTSISAPSASHIETRATRKRKPLEIKGIILCIVVIDLFLEVSTSSGVAVETDIPIFAPSTSTTRNRGKGKQKQSKSAKQPSKSESSKNVSSSESSSKNTSRSSSSSSRAVQSESATQFLALHDGDSSSNRVWKGISATDLSLFQAMGNRWDRTMRRRGGDLSVSPANYYTSSRRYALTWAAYRLDHQSWGNRNLNGAIILESQLEPITLSKIELPNNRDTQSVLAPSFI